MEENYKDKVERAEVTFDYLKDLVHEQNLNIEELKSKIREILLKSHITLEEMDEINKVLEVY